MPSTLRAQGLADNVYLRARVEYEAFQSDSILLCELCCSVLCILDVGLDDNGERLTSAVLIFKNKSRTARTFSKKTEKPQPTLDDSCFYCTTLDNASWSSLYKTHLLKFQLGIAAFISILSPIILCKQVLQKDVIANDNKRSRQYLLKPGGTTIDK